MAGIELATAYVSIVPETSKLEAGLKSALNGTAKQADAVGTDIGKRMAETASKALKSGWKPDQDIMAGIPDTKLDRIGARMGQVIGKGVVAGLKAQQIGRDFGSSFAAGAGSIGLGSVISGWRSDLKDQPNKLGFLAGKGMSAGLQAGLAGATAIIGTALKTGFDRLIALDNAQNKLRSILRTQGNTQDFDRINKAVQAAVDKTPFSLDAAFGTAVQAIGAGAKDIERFMKNVTDAAGFAGTDLERMGLIFNQVLAKGKLTGEETMQLMEAGLPARSWIQKSYDLTAEQFDKMQQDGEITLEMLQKSVEQFAPGMAKALGDTLQGSIDNMQTSLARTGANFLSAVFGGPTGDATEGLKSAVQRITEMLNNLNTWIVANKDKIRDFFEGAKDAAAKVVEVLGNIADLLREHPGLIQAAVVAFAAFKTIQGISAVVTALTGMNTALTATPGLAAAAAASISGVVAALAPITAIIASMGAANSIANNIQDTDYGILETLQQGAGAPFRIAGDLLGTPVPDWADPYGSRNPGVSIPGGGGPNASRERRGLAPINAADSILGNIAGGTGLPNSVGSSGMIPRGTAGQGYFNSRAAAAQLDARLMSDEAILAQVPSGNYDGGAVSDLTQGLADCSSAIEDLVNIIDGQPTAGREMTTFNAAEWLTSRGFRPGTAPGALNVGFTNAGTPHMEATLPGGTNFNWGNNTDAARGGRTNSMGAFSPNLTQRFYRYGKGGGVSGAGSSTSDSIPAMLSNGEHVLSSSDVKAMGGQSSVYQFRKGLKMAKGGAVGKRLQDMRTEGAIPAGAGDMSEAGSSTIAGLIDIGGEVINSVIDQAASAVSTAASVAATMGTMGAGGGPMAGQAAGSAAQFAIGMGTNAAKRGVSYGFDMLGIGVDTLLGSLMPFGKPRWLSQDARGFMPQWDIQGALGNLMSGGAQTAAQSSVDPATTIHGQGQGGAPGPMGPMDPMAMQAGLPGPPMFNNTAGSFLQTELTQPEVTPANVQPMFKVDNIYTTDAEAVGRELTKRGNLAQMQYTGRP
jgi:tape measure domain-containing protein